MSVGAADAGSTLGADPSRVISEPQGDTERVRGELRKLPGIDRLLGHSAMLELAAQYGRQLALDTLRQVLDDLRRTLRAGAPYPGDDGVVSMVQDRLAGIIAATLVGVINATGVVLHTNLGRAPLSGETLEAMRLAAVGYSNLEFDLSGGTRGSRYTHAEALLCRLTGAEAALIVNNNAGAVLLALSALARDRQVIISRGHLVEIGGGFRIPDVMAQSGARLVEVGTTNRTYIEDYAGAINEQTAALMRVHSSNFRIVGFAHQASLEEMVALARQRNLLTIDDLGSGALLDTSPFHLAHEPMVQESVAAGADLVTFSGDKLLGGPQAGLIVGKHELVTLLRRFPLTRALRVDKTTIAGIQANLLHYLKGEALQRIPVWRMIAEPAERIAVRSRDVIDRLGPCGVDCAVRPGRSMVGGGSLPEESLPTMLLVLPSRSPTALAEALRSGRPPVVPRIEDDQVVLDLRTVFPWQEADLARRLREALDL